MHKFMVLGVIVILFLGVFVSAGVNSMFFTKEENSYDSNKPELRESPKPECAKNEDCSQGFRCHFQKCKLIQDYSNLEKNKTENISLNTSIKNKKKNGFLSFFSTLASIFEKERKNESINHSNKTLTNKLEEKKDYGKKSWIQKVIDTLIGRKGTYSPENITNNETNITYTCGNFVCEYSLGESLENCAADCL